MMQVNQSANQNKNHFEQKTIVQHYLSAARPYKGMSKQNAIELALRYQLHQDPEAFRVLILAHLWLVIKLAYEYQKCWNRVELLDLVQEGTIGLICAVKRFDPDKNVKFSYYAVFWIKAYILKFIIRNARLVKPGSSATQKKMFFNLSKEKQKLAAKGIYPDIKQLSEHMGIPEKDVAQMDQQLSGKDISLSIDPDKPTYGDKIEYLMGQSSSVEEELVDKERQAIAQQKLKAFKALLPPRERHIYEKRMIAETPLTLKTLGQQFGVSVERIRQIESGILKKGKKYLSHEMSDHYATPEAPTSLS